MPPHTRTLMDLKRSGRLTLIVLFLFIALCILSTTLSACAKDRPEPSGAKLVATFFDVGQADAIFITLPNGATLLIDAATKSAKVACTLKDMEVDRLDYLVLTHPHEDHIGGAADVIEEFEIGEIWMPRASHTSKTYEDLLLAIKAKDMQISECKAGRVMIDGEGLKAVFAGPAEVTDDLNMSAVLSVTYGDVTFLFTGDAENESERAMLKAGTVPAADLLKVGHHGSSTSTGDSFLDAVRPSVGIIQVGAGNSYGHPSVSTLDRLDAAGVEVYRTDLHGTITVETDGKTLRVSGER